MDIQRLTFHPVHLVNTDKTLNPTALVPFCSVSGNYSAMGERIKQMDVPVCNSFMPKIVKDQLCYTVDLNEMKKKTGSNNNVFFTFFSRESDSTFTNVRPFVRSFVCPSGSKTPQQLKSFIFHHTTFIFHHFSFILHSSFIILHSSFLISRLLSFSAC